MEEFQNRRNSKKFALRAVHSLMLFLLEILSYDSLFIAYQRNDHETLPSLTSPNAVSIKEKICLPVYSKFSFVVVAAKIFRTLKSVSVARALTVRIPFVEQPKTFFTGPGV